MFHLHKPETIRLPESEAIIDQGAFVWTCDGDFLATEKFTMAKMPQRGVLRKKTAGLRLVTAVTSQDGSLNLESCQDYDARLYPTDLEVINRARTLEGHQERCAVFSFRETGAQLKMGAKGQLTTLNLGYESGWLVAVEPSVMSYAVMLGRTDRVQGGVHAFTILRTSAMDNFFTLAKIHLPLKFVRTFDVSFPQGKRTPFHYFTGEERTIVQGQDVTPVPQRTVHLWSDGDQRLRKVMFTSGAQDVIVVREGEEALSALLSPQQKF